MADLAEFVTNLPKFYPPTIFILAILLYKAANPLMFCPLKCLLVAMCQNFVPYGIHLVMVQANAHMIYVTVDA